MELSEVEERRLAGLEEAEALPGFVRMALNRRRDGARRYSLGLVAKRHWKRRLRWLVPRIAEYHLPIGGADDAAALS